MLQRLLTPEEAVQWLRARGAAALVTDSRRVGTVAAAGASGGAAFVAWPGWASDGRRFVRDALAAGAVACLVEDEGVEAFGFDAPEFAGQVATMSGLKAATGLVADLWFHQPSAALDVIAVTGTNGKTSSACWAAEALGRCGQRAAIVGTLGIGEPGALVSTGLTTPDPVTLHGALRGFVDRGVTACALEASSIGLVEHRLAGLRIAVAVFTNFTRDHLDYHGTMEAYWAAKRRLFDWPGLRAAVVNVDDGQGAALASELRGGALDLWTASKAQPARLHARDLRYTPAGLAFEVVEHRDASIGTAAAAGAEAVASATVATSLVGDYNASNLLGVIGALRALGVPLAEAAAAAAQVSEVPGRLQRLQGAGLEVVVDYAHTPDALAQVLGALRPLAAARGGRLWCLFGCGGNRDATKRPLMGAIASRLADRVIVTSDNPRDEDPRAILAQIVAGLERRDHAEVIEPRGEAIAHAIAAAAAGDVVLLAGKGHEDYQEIAGVKRPFSDLAEARSALARRGAATEAAR